MRRKKEEIGKNLKKKDKKGRNKPKVRREVK